MKNTRNDNKIQLKNNTKSQIPNNLARHASRFSIYITRQPCLSQLALK